MTDNNRYLPHITGDKALLIDILNKLSDIAARLDAIEKRLPVKRVAGATPKKAGIRYDSKTQTFSGITDELKAKWRELFPHVDIDIEIGKAMAWAMLRRPKKNWEAFFVGWFSRSNEFRRKNEAPGKTIEQHYAELQARKKWKEQL